MLKNDKNATNQAEIVIDTASKSSYAHEKELNVVRVSPNDLLIASGSQDKNVKVWDS